MLLIRNTSTNPYFNLAAEEYCIDHFDETVVMLWRNDKTVVVGYNQNSMEEVNQDYVRENEIGVVRRLTGGGAVFHDLGNVNYTFIQKYEEGLFNDYSFFTRPVRDYLASLGVAAELSGRNDLLIDGMKFSGNAQTRRGGKIMHHGTLLFSANVSDISGSLKPNKLKMESKGIKSVRSRVTNISSHLADGSFGVADFYDGLCSHFVEHLDAVRSYALTGEDIAAIDALVREKYGTWDWNYGKSPAYTTRIERKFDFGLVDARILVEKGRIANLKIFGDFFGVRDIAELESRFVGLAHERSSCEKALESVELGTYISGMTAADLLGLIIA